MIERCDLCRALTVRRRADLAASRLQARRLGRRQGLPEDAMGRLELVVTEAVNNLLVHAGGGELLLSAARTSDRRWIDVLALDHGPGILRLGDALHGGSSSAGGLGEGLGAIRRLSDLFEIYAPPGAGTCVASRIYDHPPEPLAGRGEIELGAVCRPKRGHRACGDAWGYRHLEHGGGLLLVVDGLGHGEPAAEAAEESLETLAASARPTPRHLLQTLQSGLASTRGAAAVAVELRPANNTLIYAGLGNLEGTLYGPGRRTGLVSLDGTLGFGRARIQEFEHPWPEGGILIVFTDGISSGCDLADHAGLRFRHPAAIAGVLYRDHGEDRDDTTVVAIRRSRRS